MDIPILYVKMLKMTKTFHGNNNGTKSLYHGQINYQNTTDNNIVLIYVPFSLRCL